MWEWNLFSIVVLPSDILHNLVLLVLVPMLHIHLSLLLSQLQLILEHQLSICLLLHRPHSLLLLLSSLLILCVSDLLGFLFFNRLDLVRSETLKVIGDISVTSQLTNGSISILSHDITFNSVFNLELVLGFLLSLPGSFLVFLFLGKSLVFFLHLLHHVSSLHRHFVF